ncbi:MAG: Uridine phosphorylase [Candidatus Nomurabacteria bacterium GW2011_GWB1_37_5]|uniref:Uridine phosphorylase n=1 Tax=Candidatus Nomurabacteria bacterium GW2011_GWB1_37_5 TaxID=1618742 RepID=A0A0G0H8P1_9BACT|nr:MAG: Uridine phosphorylase [Candidatus Nomurabacteria bacterium GW2011_GWB1_37_5]
MYKSLSDDELKKLVGLPLKYKVKGFICMGAWDDEKYFDAIKLILNKIGIKYACRKMDNFLSHVLEICIDGNTYWFAVLYGGTMLSEYLHLACSFGSEKNINIGSCGGLYPEMNSTDLIIPTWSFGRESSAFIYDKENKDFRYYPDDMLSNKLESKIDKKYKIWKGPIVTCHAMLGETFEDVKLWSKEGYYGVEMETSTLFAVSKHFNVPSTAIVYVADNLIKGQIVGDESHEKQKGHREEVKEEIYKAAIQTLLE